MTPNEFVKFCLTQGDKEEVSGYLFQEIMEAAKAVELSPERDSDYLETHYIISNVIDNTQDESKTLSEIQLEYGMGGLWMKAESLTDEFQAKYKDTVFGEELDYFDTLDQFLNDKLK